MNRRTILVHGTMALLLCLGVAVPRAIAQEPGQFGNAQEAKAMLLKAVTAKALDMFAKGEGGFRNRDLYPFCFNMSDGKLFPYANPNAKATFGTDIRDRKDANGKAFGAEQYAAAQKPAGQITEVNYMFPKPGSDPKPVPKVTFMTRVGDLGCGVGYYK